jgi:hypothetical protein
MHRTGVESLPERPSQVIETRGLKRVQVRRWEERAFPVPMVRPFSRNTPNDRACSDLEIDRPHPVGGGRCHCRTGSHQNQTGRRRKR